MNTANLKAYAPKARRDFIAAVSKQAEKYGVTAKVIHPLEITGDVCLVNGKPFPAAIAPRINKLADLVGRLGYQQTMEQVAYSWFNRLIAIRYMELHDYLGHGRRVLSHPEHPTSYQILEECTDLAYGNDGEAGQLPHISHNKVVELKLDGTKDEELYRELLLAQCHALHTAMPFLFEPVDDDTELLLPENLTKTDSLIHDLITEIPEDDWKNIEIIGWLYQFYISEKKDQVIGKVVKIEDIPAATQLFTPNWIVKYMVQNSLGAQWLATYPDSPLKSQMEYYIEPAEQTEEARIQIAAITPKLLNPEELTLIDPGMGSGHILVEAYELFKTIYLERGYRLRDIPQLILEKNLFGLDIDSRAAQLAGFALMMKGREDDRRLFDREIQLNVMALQVSSDLDIGSLNMVLPLANFGLKLDDITELIQLFEKASTFGSLIQVPKGLAEKLPALKKLVSSEIRDWVVVDILERLAPLIVQAELLVNRYDTVVANPPYMGSKYQAPTLREYAKDYYPDSKTDIFSMFIERAQIMSRVNGMIGIVAPFGWMFLSSYERFRRKLIRATSLASVIQLEYNAFEPACVPVASFTARNVTNINYSMSCIRLSDFKGHENQAPRTLQAIRQRDCGWLYTVDRLSLESMPGAPIAYWAPKEIINAFSGSVNVGDLGDFTGSQNKTGDNDLFLRLWWEVAKSSLGQGKPWCPYSKGGEYRKWFGNLQWVINWTEKSRQYYVANTTSNLLDKSYWYREGITYTRITTLSFAGRYLPEGTVYDMTGPSLHPDSIPPLLSYLNSRPASYILKMLNPTMDCQVRDVKSLPYNFSTGSIEQAKHIGEKLVGMSKIDWDAFECSWDFQYSPLLVTSSEQPITLESSYSSWDTQNRGSIAEMKRLEEENNRLFIDAYSLADELASEVPVEQITLTVNPAYRYGVKGTEEERNTRFREDTMKELVSYAIGCMMGRYSLDAPGLIYANSGNEGFEPGQYTTFEADDDGIVPITDSEWYDDDAANRVVEFIAAAWPAEHLEQNLNFIATNLSPKKGKGQGEGSRDTIRRYLCDKFYKDHIQIYKKRPIYWLFSSGKQKAFQCLVYLHRYNESTLARLRTEYVIPLTAKLSSHIEKLENDNTASSSTAETKKLEKEIKRLQKQQTELTEFDEKLKHFADQRIKLDLDDGVKVNYGKFGDLLAEVKAIHGEKV
jgi:hypothetical protein